MPDSRDNSSPEDSAPSRLPIRSFLKTSWRATRNPLIAVIALIFASLFLIFLQKEKADFEVAQNGPLVLVKDGDKNLATNGVRFVLVEKLVEGATANIAAVPVENFVPADIIRTSAHEIPFQYFKNPEELFAKLSDGILRQRNNELKHRYGTLEKQRQAENDLSDQKSIAENELRILAGLDTPKSKEEAPRVDSAPGGPPAMPAPSATPETYLEINTLLTNSDEKGPLRESLNKKYGKVKGGFKQEYQDIKKKVGEFFDNKKAEKSFVAQACLTEIEKTGIHYQQLIRNTFELLTDPEKFNNFVFPDRTKYERFAIVLDEKSGLGALYKIVWVTLLGVILFALLYLVLLPLKHLFFWTESGEMLSDYAKKLLDRPTSSVTPPVARTLILAVAAVGAGTAALAASPYSPLKSDQPSPDAIATAVNDKLIEANSRPPRGQDPKPPGGGGGSDDTGNPDTDRLEIARLYKIIEVLAAENVYLRETRPRDLHFAGEVANLRGDFARVSGRIGDPLLRPRDTLFGDLASLVRKEDFNPFKSDMEARFASVGNLITGTDPGALNQNSVFGKLNNLTNSLGTKGPNELTAINYLRDMNRGIGTAADPPNNTTLFGQSQLTRQSVDKVSSTADSVRRDQLGTSGRNLSTATLDLFSRERYQVSDDAYQAINGAIGKYYPALVEVIGSLRSENLWSDGDLIRTLEAKLGRRLQKDHKRLILRYARVGQR